MNRPRLLIEDWLPAAAIGVECMRERGSASALAPTTFLHVWWARRPLTAARAAVLGSLLPADFPHDAFERLLGFGRPGEELVTIRKMMDTGHRIKGGFNCGRAFANPLDDKDGTLAAEAARGLWGNGATVLDPMAGGGSIPLEAARLGFLTWAGEYNSVATSVLEATVDYPFRFGEALARKARQWSRAWVERAGKRLAPFYPQHKVGAIHAYIFARTVACPDTGHPTPLVPDWHLAKPSGHSTCGPGCTMAVPIADRKKGTWRIEVRRAGRGPGQLREPPRPTYAKGKGVSLFTGSVIPADYIKAKAQQGQMQSALYALAIKTRNGLTFEPPAKEDLDALKRAEEELSRLRPGWEKANIIPTEEYPQVSTDERPRIYGMPRWADMFTPRQLLCMGVLVEELRNLRPEILKAEGEELGEAVVHLLAFALNKFLNHNCSLTRWENTRGVVKGKMDRHDYSFKVTFAELAPCHAGAGLEWAIDNVLEAYEKLCELPRSESAQPVEVSLGSATNLPQFADKSITAVVVDPPYTDNVQYSELADFFYVWLKRTQGHRRPEWFSTYLSNHDEEAVVNVSRFRDGGRKPARQAREESHRFYQKLMADTFREAHRVLRDDGVLTVMFTHKKQEAWESLFTSLIEAGFTVTATWPVKTESEHSLHQARKNAAQSTVILVARKREEGAGIGWFDSDMRQEIAEAARNTAAQLEAEGLNRVDQLVGSFGPAMEVYSRYDEVSTDTSEAIGVESAIDEASAAVMDWRIEELAKRGLNGVEPEGRFYLLCWDVLGAAEFRFNEAHLLGKAVGMDVDQLIVAGLVSKEGDKVRMLPAKARRRGKALEPEEVIETLYGPEIVRKRRTKKDALKVHPNDPEFRTAIDGCHALALRYLEAGGDAGGIGSARALARQQGWGPDSSVSKLMDALLRAAPEAVRWEKGQRSVAAEFPEFRAWHTLVEPLFGIAPLDWTEKAPPQLDLLSDLEETEEEEAEEDEDAADEEEEDEESAEEGEE